MSGPSLPPYLLSQAVAINFTAVIFLGFYFISAVYANRWLIFTDEGWKIRKNIYWHTLATTNITLLLLLFVLALTVNSSIGEAAFVEQGGKLSDYEEAPWKGVVQCALSGVIILLADTVLMHRLWVTHMRQMAVMWFPIFLWFGGVACIAMQIFLQVKNIQDPDFGPYKWAKVQTQVGPGIVFLPFLASTILLNAYCTGEFVEVTETEAVVLLFLFKVFWYGESGVLYLAMSIAHFIAYFGHSGFVIHMNGGLHTVMIGIAYDLIIIRVGQNRSEEDANLSGGKLTTFQVVDMNEGKSDQSTISVLTGETTEFRKIERVPA